MWDAYILPLFKVRITFDKHIRAYMGDKGFWNPDLAMTNLMNTGKLVLEVKYNEMLPLHIKRLLTTVEKVPMAFSKYCFCRMLTG